MIEHSSLFFQGWEDDEHVREFDWFYYFPTPLFLKQFEYFNEVRLLKEYFQKNGAKDKSLFEVGCATGEVVRYLNKRNYDCDYSGFDISETALAAANRKYPKGKFVRIQENTKQIAENHGQADIVFCRDVIMHQTDPWGFLESLVELTSGSLIMRLRTRDVGTTCLDPELSCQAHYSEFWMPYMVINVDELCEHIAKHEDVKKITILKSYGILGGHTRRFVPRELYFADAGTAETSIWVEKGERQGDKPEIVIREQPDEMRYSLFERAWLKLWLTYKRPQ
jgi:2-polyprenyl-3-methyl-5-hydroxy-6-metoxy-1,4-benzoquinol methylase